MVWCSPLLLGQVQFAGGHSLVIILLSILYTRTRSVIATAKGVPPMTIMPTICSQVTSLPVQVSMQVQVSLL